MSGVVISFGLASHFLPGLLTAALQAKTAHLSRRPLQKETRHAMNLREMPPLCRERKISGGSDNGAERATASRPIGTMPPDAKR